MAKNELLLVKDAVHKLQLSLLDGITKEDQLFAAGLLLSKGDYRDVVTERSIAMMCGYPLCNNSLKSERPWKGRYRISLKEHKVYDVQETFMYCSTSCLINNQTFSAGLPEERSSNLDSLKLNKVLEKYESFSMNSAVDMGRNGELGLSELRIKEKTNIETGEVSFDEWIGPSNAIDGYVPRTEQNMKTRSNKPKKEYRQADAKLDFSSFLSSDVDFTSVIIDKDEYSISKTLPPLKSGKPRETENAEEIHQDNHVRKSSKTVANVKKTRQRKPAALKNTDKSDGKSCLVEDRDNSIQNGVSGKGNELHLWQGSTSGAATLKSSLRASQSKKAARTVSWADQRNEDDNQTLCKLSEIKDYQNGVASFSSRDTGKEAPSVTNSESHAGAKSQASADVAHRGSVASEAVSKGKANVSPDGIFTEAVLKWPAKKGFSNAELLDSDDSWYESPPDGFNLSLSPFCSMFNSLFAWISSSSIAYIYGKGESFHEEYTNVNGREYPHKVIAQDGRSSEIKQTLAGYLARALPGVVAELGLPVPVSTLEQGMARLLDTMSFFDPLPSLRMKQWQVIALVFVNALSVSRIPPLTTYLMEKSDAVLKVLESAHISAQEYEIIKELMIPLNPSTQSG